MKNLLKQTLEGHQAKINCLISANVPLLGEKSRLRDACEYALLNGGKRFRPALVFLVADALNSKCDLSFAALAVEYFHTASLIADDLPCMDDDAERRNMPSLHIAFGEATALMASYALISAGYGAIAKNAEHLSSTTETHAVNGYQICCMALENVSFNTGLFGATGGQFLDLNPPDLEIKTLYSIANKKTASLFEISFVLGWLFGGGDLKKLPLVKKAAYHFGMAFQIGDDLGDMQQDLKNGTEVNIALSVGKERAQELFDQESASYQQLLGELNIASPELSALATVFY
ncbi:MAG: polyprenyl synthetase family protein [Parachlamydiaceae bacterium]|nr:polyprenyl synthetase family protein [Parachlamydiaceae bacterium]